MIKRKTISVLISTSMVFACVFGVSSTSMALEVDDVYKVGDTVTINEGDWFCPWDYGDSDPFPRQADEDMEFEITSFEFYETEVDEEYDFTTPSHYVVYSGGYDLFAIGCPEDLGSSVAVCVVSGNGSESSPYRFEILPIDDGSDDQAPDSEPEPEPEPDTEPDTEPVPSDESSDDTPYVPDSSSSSSSSAPAAPIYQTPIEEFVVRSYDTLLGRAADEEGMRYWVSLLNNGTGGTEIIKGFIGSQEFICRDMSDEYFVDVLYRVFFNRTPDDAGREYWLSKLASGVSRDEVLEGFIGSEEWVATCDFLGISQ